ncbi:MAG: hypothetical protein WDW36_002026 [Sanguina aurantia]
MWGIYVGKQQQQRQQQRQQRQRQRTAETRGIAAAGRCFAVQRHWREPVPGLADQHSRVSPSGTCASTMNNQPPPGAAPSEPMGPLHAQTGQIWLDTRAEQLGLPLTNTSTASEPAGGDATGNTALGFIFNPTLVKQLFDGVAERYADRQGGYTRIKTEPLLRRGDAAEMAVIELL